jgi:hypothetical protein
MLMFRTRNAAVSKSLAPNVSRLYQHVCPPGALTNVLRSLYQAVDLICLP